MDQAKQWLEQPEHNPEPSKQRREHPKHDIEQPKQRMEHPEHNIEQPEQRMEHPEHNIEQPEQRMEHPEHDIEQPEQRMEHPEHSVEPFEPHPEPKARRGEQNRLNKDQNKMNEKKKLLKQFAARIRELRIMLNCSQEQMAVHFGIGRSGYIKYEYGCSFPSLRILTHLAARMDVSLDWLATGKGPVFYREKEAAAEPAGSGAAKAGMEKDVQALLEQMNRIPLLRYEILSFFFRFRRDHPDLLPD